VQRQLYPALLLITIALAAALYLRPTVGEELMALAGARGDGTTASYGQAGSGGASGYAAQATVFPQAFSAGSSQRASTTQTSQYGQSAEWPVDQANEAGQTGESLAGDVPAGSTSRSPSYPQAGARNEWPQSAHEYSRSLQAAAGTDTSPPQYEAGPWANPPSGSESARSPVGPSHPLAGSLGNDPQVRATPSPYPPSGGATQPWADGDALGRYPTAGSPAVSPSYSQQPTRPTDPGTSYGQPPPPYTGPAPAYAGQSGDPPNPAYVGSPDYAPNAASAAPPHLAPGATGREYPPAAVQPGYPPGVAGMGYGPPVGQPRDGLPVTSPMTGPTQPGRPATTPTQPERKPCEGAQVLAWVGDDVILASEVMPAYEEIMGQTSKSQLASRSPDRLEFEKKALIAKILESRIRTKLLCQEAKRTIPEEALPEIKRKIANHFEEKELPRRLKKAGGASRQELDEKLRAIGSSVDRMKRAYIEQSLAYEWLHQQKGPTPKVSHEQMLDYYWEHAADFETPARARWEKLSVRKPRYADPQEARARLAQMGNQVIRGMSMADALKGQPQPDLECEGGVQGWVTQGNLEVSRGLEQAIFGLPVGQPSRIFEDGDYLYIVRVLQREEFKRTPFEDSEVQKQIREKLQEARQDEQEEEYLAKLRKEIPVRTVFDDDPELAELRRQMDATRK